MQPTIRRDLFNQKVFDSGSLGPLTSVIHQFDREGVFYGKALRDGMPIESFSFKVDARSEVRQLSIDLSAPTTKQPSTCCEEDNHNHWIVSPQGYVLFHAARGHGYSTLVTRVGEGDGREPAFDSSKLHPGDLFALSLVEPTTYSVNDHIGGGKATIIVRRDLKRTKNLKNLEPIYVEVKEGEMHPSELELAPAQGMVFRICTDSRIMIQKTGASTEEMERVLHRSFSAKA